MPVKFITPSSHRVFMLDKDANFMLKAMKTSGNIPGALYPEDIEDALQNLNEKINIEDALKASSEGDDVNSEANDDDNNDENNIGLRTKAFPLIELMQRAIRENEKLIWDYE